MTETARQRIFKFIKSHPEIIERITDLDTRERILEEKLKKKYTERTKTGLHNHLVASIDVLKQIALFDPDLVSMYIHEEQNKGVGSGLSKSKREYLLNFIDENKSNISTDKEKIQYNECKINNYASEFMRLSIVVSDPIYFPLLNGIYLVRFLNNNKWDALYVGKSENLKTRWYQHHRMPEIELLQKIGIQIEFRYSPETSLIKLNGSLEEIESQLIKAFKPKLNQTSVLQQTKTN